MPIDKTYGEGHGKTEVESDQPETYENPTHVSFCLFSKPCQPVMYVCKI